MGFVNTKEKILCFECGAENEILTLEPYSSQRIVVGTVGGGGTRLRKDAIPMRILTSGKCNKCGASLKEAIDNEFPGARLIKG